MRWLRGAGGAALVVVALAVGAAWTTGAPRLDDAGARVREAVEQPGAGTIRGTVSAVESAVGVAETTFAAPRSIEARSGPVWVFPGLAAALAALCLLRRLRAVPVPHGNPRLLRDWVSRRGPPLASLS